MIYVQEKRDGEQVRIKKKKGMPILIASHNMEKASPDIITRLQSTKAWPHIVQMLEIECEQYDAEWVLYMELIKAGRSPTGIERAHKKPDVFMFDILDEKLKRFIGYPGVYQKCYDYKIPIVRLVGNYNPKSMDELMALKQEWLKWARRHHREGVCIKNYDEDIGQPMAKERVDLPKLTKIPRDTTTGVILPDMPPERIERALMHTYDQIQNDHQMATLGEMVVLWKTKAITMPILARHLATEAAEHHYRIPNSMYQIYLDADIEKICAKPNESTSQQTP